MSDSTHTHAHTRPNVNSDGEKTERGDEQVITTHRNSGGPDTGERLDNFL